MSAGYGLGLGRFILDPSGGIVAEQILMQRPLKRILAFLGRSIDDVINDPIARRQVIGYYKLQREIERRGEIVELESWWNPTSQG